MPAATPYLFFNGTCREAMTAYAEIFGTDPPDITDFTDMPDDAQIGMGSAAAEAVMHATLSLGDSLIFASDDLSPGGSPAMAGCNVHISFPSFEEARRVFERLSDRGEVRMPFKAEFWTPGFGTLTDRWGIRWMVSVDSPAE